MLLGDLSDNFRIYGALVSRVNTFMVYAHLAKHIVVVRVMKSVNRLRRLEGSVVTKALSRA